MKLISTFADRLREALSDTTASTLAEEIGLSKQAISMYTTGKRIPKRPTIKAIAEQLNVNAAWLSGYDVPMSPIKSDTKTDNQLSFEINYHETKVITAYHQQPTMQPAIDRILGVEKTAEKHIPKPPIYKPYEEETPTFSIKYFDELSVSAGDGNYSTDLAHYVTVKLKNEPPRGTSYIVKVNGHSMEPTLYEGDKIFVKAQPDLEVGDIGIFVVNSSMFIKEYGGKKGLLSHNPACGNIKVNEFNSFWCLGKYLGKCEEEFNE